MTFHKVRILLAAPTGTLPASVKTVVEQAIALVPSGDGIQVGAGVRRAEDFLAATEYGDVLGADKPNFVAFVEVGAADRGFDWLADRITPVVDALQAVMDIGNSALIAGENHLLMERFGANIMVFALQSRTDRSEAEFFDYWANHHGPLTVKNSRGKGSYYQLHALAEPSAALAARFGMRHDYIGHAGGWMDDTSRLNGFFHNAVASGQLEDELNFIDHSRSCLNVYEVLVGPCAAPLADAA